MLAGNKKKGGCNVSAALCWYRGMMLHRGIVGYIIFLQVFFYVGCLQLLLWVLPCMSSVVSPYMGQSSRDLLHWSGMVGCCMVWATNYYVIDG